MAKRVDRLREQGRRERGRSWLRWEDCERSEINSVGVVGDWRELAEGRGQGEVEKYHGQGRAEA